MSGGREWSGSIHEQARIEEGFTAKEVEAAKAAITERGQWITLDTLRRELGFTQGGTHE